MRTNKSQVDNLRTASGRNSSPDVIADELSLTPLLQALWGYRLTILLFMASIVVVFSFWAAGTYFSQPVERHANLGFRLLFNGANDGLYPNGSEFSTGDIIGSPVLAAVYDINGLERYLTYEQFRDALFVNTTGSGINMLDLEYQSKLAATGLTAVERDVLEAEYRQKHEALQVAQFSLNFVVAEEKQLSIPDVLSSKTLNDVLVEWAEQVATRGGVLGSDTSPPNVTMLNRETLALEDYTVQIDFLRGEINRLAAAMDSIDELPGAGRLRIRERGLSLSDIRSSLEDLLRYRIEPTMTFILTNGIVRSPNLAATYFSSRRFQVELEQQEARGIRSALEGSLRVYNTGLGTPGLDVEGSGEASNFGSSSGGAGATMIPQLNDSFIDRVIRMAGREEDIGFRQDLIERIIEARRQEVRLDRELSYYDRVNGFFSGAVRASREGSTGQDVVHPVSEQVGWVETRISEVFDGIVSARKQSVDFNTELSVQNLNAGSSLFVITNPFSAVTARGVTLQTLGSYGLFVLLFGFLQQNSV